MRRSWCSAAIGGVVLLSSIALAQDSGPGPAPGATSKEYYVVVVRASGFDQGTLAFQRSEESPPASDPNADDDATTGTSTPGTTTTGGTANTPTTTTNPTTPITTPTPGSTPTPTTNPAMTDNTTGTTSTTSGDAAPTKTEAPSYWTRARANGRVATQSNDPSSSDYWTTARANGQVVAGDTSGNGGGGSGEEGSVTSGVFTADIAEQSATGTWHAVDLGDFSLWYATADSSAGSVIYIGYATADTIVGRTSVGTGGFIETLFQGSFFVGQATDSAPTEDPTDMSE